LFVALNKRLAALSVLYPTLLRDAVVGIKREIALLLQLQQHLIAALQNGICTDVFGNGNEV
jgi:hypothetical protein